MSGERNTGATEVIHWSGHAHCRDCPPAAVDFLARIGDT